MTEAAVLPLAESEQNPYLLGLFAPVRRGHGRGPGGHRRDPARPLRCVSPKWTQPALRGARRYHWFDGDGMVHAMTFEDGRPRYRKVAGVRLPQRVPLGFHATWVRADQLRRNET